MEEAPANTSPWGGSPVRVRAELGLPQQQQQPKTQSPGPHPELLEPEVRSKHLHLCSESR